MVKHIDLFMPPSIGQGVLEGLTESLHHALEDIGVRSRLLIAERENPEPFLQTLIREPPDFTFCFNGLLPDREGRVFADLIKIPHVAYVTGNPVDFAPLHSSYYTILVASDRQACQFFDRLGAEKTLFVPLAASPLPLKEVRCERTYPLVCLHKVYDYLSIREQWRSELKGPVADFLETVADQCEADASLHLAPVLLEALEKEMQKPGFDSQQFAPAALARALEGYLKGSRVIKMLEALGPVDVHLFGTTVPERYLSGIQATLHTHPPLQSEEVLPLLEMTQILLVDSPLFPDGAHPLVFSAMIKGAAVFARENPYLEKAFVPGEEIILFSPNELASKLQSLDKEGRLELAEKGQKKVLHSHTWQHRAEELFEKVGPLLDTYGS